MRLATINDRLVAVRDGMVLDVEQASDGQFGPDVMAALARSTQLRQWYAGADFAHGRPLDDATLGAPVPRPQQVFAIALNYRPHAAEGGFEPPELPLVFTKFPTCVAGPVTQVALPKGKVDWEAEIVAVVGSGGHRISRARAWDALAGVTMGQDLSERVLQHAGHPAQFSLGKSHSGFGPTGPALVSADELPDPDDIAFGCSVDGELLQHGRTVDMIFPIDHLVEHISAVCPLLPGDLIFTGTPSGVGARRTPPCFLQPGQTLVSHAEGIGEIRQTFV